ncbi:nitroreductase [Pseudomonas putida]|uniref:nitroreductase n=1 Tax=Pseudomonas putida TaxID=303 RepID=UPI000980AF6C|nr:nitroreductase [Pseudomonas putida]OMQ39374.1 nitroreductase [Pseudomonas putida]
MDTKQPPLKAHDAELSARQVITSRRSVRAFLRTPVRRETIEQVLELAARAPSGSNVQPWQVWVLTDAPLINLGLELQSLALAGSDDQKEQPQTHHVREPYRSRRRKVARDLYESLDITRDDTQGMLRQTSRNFIFFDAPVGLFFTIDRDLDSNRWLDYGMFLQNIMLAAKAYGLDTCAQQAFVKYEAVIARRLGLADSQKLVCGMALGYGDLTAAENTFVAERAPLQAFTQFVDTLY